MRQIPVNTVEIRDGRKVFGTVLSGYYKFYFASMWRNFNGVPAVLVIHVDE